MRVVSNTVAMRLALPVPCGLRYQCQTEILTTDTAFFHREASHPQLFHRAFRSRGSASYYVLNLFVFCSPLLIRVNLTPYSFSQGYPTRTCMNIVFHEKRPAETPLALVPRGCLKATGAF